MKYQREWGPKKRLQKSFVDGPSRERTHCRPSSDGPGGTYAAPAALHNHNGKEISEIASIKRLNMSFFKKGTKNKLPQGVSF